MDDSTPAMKKELDSEKTKCVDTELSLSTSAGETQLSDATVINTTALEANPTGVSSAAESAGISAIIRDRFVIEERLGSGAMGQIFRARDLRKEEAEDDNPFVAIKFLGEEFSKHPRALISLQREAKKTQQLAHPNILTVYDFDRDGDRVYMTMELLKGAPLSSWTKIKFPEGETPTVSSLVSDMASGLTHAHKFGVIHSDFKPDNVFVTTSGRVKILDFGIARIADSAVEKDSYDAGELGALTTRYASLEMLRGNNDPHPADDIYALGIIAYQLFSGVHPFAGKTAEQAFQQKLVPQHISGLKRYQWKAIVHALELQREDRTPSAELFLREFSGTNRRNRNFLFAFAMLAIISTILAYQLSTPDGPSIAFDQLPTEVQQQFQRNLELGKQSAEIQDWDGASRYYITAYDLHPRNSEAEEGLETLAIQLIEVSKGLESHRQKEQMLQMIEAFSDNEYLANHQGLIVLHDQLERELPR